MKPRFFDKEMMAEGVSLNAAQSAFAVFFAICWGTAANAQPKWKAFAWGQISESKTVPRLLLSVVLLNLLPIAFFMFGIWALSRDPWRPHTWDAWAAFTIGLAIMPAFSAFGFLRVWTGAVQLRETWFYPPESERKLLGIDLTKEDLSSSWGRWNIFFGVAYIGLGLLVLCFPYVPFSGAAQMALPQSEATPASLTVHPWFRDNFLALAAQSIAAGLGAWAAFRFEAARDARRERSSHADAIRQAIFELASQRNHLIILDRQFLTPWKDNPGRFFLMSPIYGGFTTRPLDEGKLLFLLKTDRAGILSELHLANLQFMTAASLVQVRSDLHLRLQAKLEAVDKGGDDAFPVEELELIAGRALFRQLRNTTDSLYSSCEGALRSNSTAITELQSVLRDLYPKERVPVVLDSVLP